MIDASVVVDLVFDGAVDLSATFVIHIDDSTAINVVGIARPALGRSADRRRVVWGSIERATV